MVLIVGIVDDEIAVSSMTMCVIAFLKKNSRDLLFFIFSLKFNILQSN